MIDDPYNDAVSRRDAVLQRDDYTCQMCGNGRSDSSSQSLRIRQVNLKDNSKEDRISNFLTVCKECDRQFGQSWFKDTDSIADIVDEFDRLIDLYDFPGTTQTYMSLSKQASYLIPEIADQDSDRYKTYVRARRKLYLKLEFGQQLTVALDRLAETEMPEGIGLEFEDHVSSWEDWLKKTRSVLEAYNEILTVDEERGELFVESNRTELTKRLLKRKREWGSLNKEYTDIIPEIGSLQNPKWDRCPNCGNTDSVWFLRDQAECDTCETVWEKKGLIRKRWAITEGENKGQKRTLAEWKEQAERRAGQS